MILVPLLNPKFATMFAAKPCELRVRGTRACSDSEGTEHALSLRLDPVACTHCLRLIRAAERTERIGGDAGGVFGPGVVRAVDALVRGERKLSEPKRFRGTVRHQQQARIM